MPINIIIFTLDHQPEGGIVQDFLGSGIVKDYSEDNPYAWLVTPVNREQLTELIDEYTAENELSEDQRGELVAWLDRLNSNEAAFVAIADRLGVENGDQ